MDSRFARLTFSEPYMRSLSSKIGAAALALVASAFGAPLSAQGLTGYNVFTFGSFTQTGTEVNGNVAVGGAFTSSNSAIGISLPNGFTGAGLVVGGSATWTNGQIYHGDVYVGGAQSFSNYQIPNGVLKPTGTPLPVNFVTEQARLTALSNSYSAMASNGSVVSQYSQLFFMGNSAGANIFNVTQADLTAATGGYHFYAPTGGSIIVNVLGVTGGQFFANTGFDFCTGVVNPTSFTGCSQGNQNSPSGLMTKLLWNVNTPSFTSISFAGSMRGSFLGPRIGLTTVNASCVGDFVVATLASGCEFYEAPYDGYVTTTSVVPEPATVSLMLAGLAGVGLVARRRNKSRNA